MRTATRIDLAVLVAVGALGCDPREKAKQPADDELTIVVEADKSRIAAQEAALEEQRKVLTQERERLRAELDKAGGGGKADDGNSQALLERAVKLVKEQEDLLKKREALLDEREGLARKVASADPGTRAALAQAAPSSDVARITGQVASREKDLAGREKSVADREKEIADRERTLAQREAALAQRDSACLAAQAKRGPVDHSPAYSRASVDKAYKALLGTMDGKGVLASDLSPARQKNLQDAATLRGPNDLERALEAIETVDATVQALAIDSDFVSQKMKRVNAMTKRAADAKAREEVTRLLQEVTRSYSDAHYQEANQALNSIVHLLEKR